MQNIMLNLSLRVYHKYSEQQTKKYYVKFKINFYNIFIKKTIILSKVLLNPRECFHAYNLHYSMF